MAIERKTESHEPHECPHCHGMRRTLSSLNEIALGKQPEVIDCPTCEGTGLVWSVCTRTVTCSATECSECPLLADLMLVVRASNLPPKKEVREQEGDADGQIVDM